MSSPGQPKIAIIGAGITGLVTAHGLIKNGFTDVTIYEADTHVDARTRDWTILLHWGLPTLFSLLPESLSEPQIRKLTSSNPHGYSDPRAFDFPVRNGITGDIVFSMPCPGAIRVSRQKFRKALVEAFERDDVLRWNKAVESWEPEDGAASKVKLRFKDGEETVVDYVVGADGTGSKIRELVFEKEPEKAVATTSGLTFATATIKSGDAAKVQAALDINPLACLMFFPGTLGGLGIMDAPDPDDLSTWTTFWVRIWSGGRTDLRGQEAIDYVKSITKDTWAPFQEMVDSTPDGSDCWASNMRYWVPTKWDNKQGRVALVGDAAHPMLPFRSQGFQHAILDADGYVKAQLAIRQDPSLKQATMESFDADVVARGSEAVMQTVSEAKKALDPEKVTSMVMANKGLDKST